jgi:ketosteroid isomerase-like protein
MAEENVEIVREHIEAFRHGDATGALSNLDPHVVLDRTRVADLESIAYGHDQLDESVSRYMGSFDEYHYEVERLTDLGSGAVLAVVTEEGRGKSSGVPVRQTFATLYTVIEGKIARVTLFPSEEVALEAVGRSE